MFKIQFEMYANESVDEHIPQYNSKYGTKVSCC